MMKIISRAEWKAEKPRVTVTPHIPNKITVHHQGSSESKPLAEVQKSFKGAETIRAIQKYHMEVNGWCFSKDTEILTNHGWKSFDTINNTDLVYTEESGFTKDWERVEYKNVKSFVFKSLNFSASLAGNHRMVVKSQLDKGEYKRKFVEDVLKNQKTPIRLPTSTNYSVAGIPPEPISFYKLLAFIVADGHIAKNGHIQIAIKKERKKLYLEDIFSTCKIHHTKVEKYTNDGTSIYCISRKEDTSKIIKHIKPDGDKCLPWDFIHLPQEYREAIIETYINTDGCPDTGTKNKYKYVCSTVKQNMDVIQALCHLSNLRTKMALSTPRNGKNILPLYVMTINKLQNILYDFRNNPVQEVIQDVWSVDAGGKTLMTRHHDCVHLTSNCDIGYHALIAPNGDIYQGREFNITGSHVKNRNTGNIGIMLIGNFEVEHPTIVQLSTLKELIKHIGGLFPTIPLPSMIYGHKEWQYTDCPGKNLYQFVLNLKFGKEKL
jgi:hypothetical protein